MINKIKNKMKNQIGSRITHLREGLNISFDELAERAAITREQLEEIEKNNIIPSLAPLLRIARVLGVRLGTFMEDYEHIGPTITRKDTSIPSISFSNNQSADKSAMLYFPLASEKTGRHMEPFIIEIKTVSEEYSLSTHEGEEFIYVLQGNIEIVYGKELITLGPGDSIYYDSIVPHHVHASGNSDARIMAVVYIPL